MFLDAHTLPNNHTLETDLCIIGAGAAGMAIARQFLHGRTRVCLVESGGLSFQNQSDALKEVDYDGPYNLGLKSMQRYFGGSTNCWGGNCSPMDPWDFQPHPSGAHAGWPIAYTALSHYFDAVAQLCQLPKGSFEVPRWQKEDVQFINQNQPLMSSDIQLKLFERRHKPLRFGRAYRNAFKEETSPVTVLLNATVMKLEHNGDGAHVQTASLRTHSHRSLAIRAKRYILCAGLENPRLLQLSPGLGNDNVGRYFMGHIHQLSGLFLEAPPYRNWLMHMLPIVSVRRGKTIHRFVGFQLHPKVQKQQALLNWLAWFSPLQMIEQSPELAALKEIAARYFQHGQQSHLLKGLARQVSLKQSCNTFLPNFYQLRNWAEQAPQRENRVTLSEKKDALGRPRSKLQFQIGPLERETLHQGQKKLAQALAHQGYGQLISTLPPPSEPWHSEYLRTSHFMGTTRMSQSPHDGVVDPNCKLFGCDNLYIAGGSVLPTSGASMVTINLLALALRLADHIKEQEH
ncbi:FAD-dependent oxidoreductase [Magnetococcus sp. PR-3]|uniref:FAD-dependent oxidoreductase n=1 Tax=Magnetococcus sp. PR-3 TaxID=3120355 RepID=UPI002FCDE7C8